MTQTKMTVDVEITIVTKCLKGNWGLPTVFELGLMFCCDKTNMNSVLLSLSSSFDITYT